MNSTEILTFALGFIYGASLLLMVQDPWQVSVTIFCSSTALVFTHLASQMPPNDPRA